ncbi:MAG: T9SS type A sorting domain-containing protein [Ignavibacteriota bacterium]
MKTSIAVFLLLVSPITAFSQYTWKLQHSDFDGRYYYCFDAISCHGNTCITAGRLVDNLRQRIYSVFWRSVDGGRTWNMQDPQLPFDTNFKNQKVFSAVTQLDNEHAIALLSNFSSRTDSSFLLRTSDGGNTWVKQFLFISEVSGVFRNMAFYDSLTGILITQKNLIFNQGHSVSIGGGESKIFITSDGGIHWDSLTTLFNDGKYQCSADGKTKFSLFSIPHGPIYSTDDSWKTMSTSTPIITSAEDPTNSYYYFNCNKSGDTLLAYGTNLFDTSATLYDRYRGLLSRSVDNGKTWGKQEVIEDFSSYLTYMTSIEKDTIISAGLGANHIAISTNHGISWRTDSLALDTVYSAFFCRGLVTNGDGNPLAIYSPQPTQFSVPSIIVMGQKAESSVKQTQSSPYLWITLNQNPVSTLLSCKLYWFNVGGEIPSLTICDILGRTVLDLSNDITRPAETFGVSLKEDVSQLPNGVYLLVLNTNGYATSKRFIVVK